MYVAVLSYNQYDKEGKLYLYRWNDLWKTFICEKVCPKIFTVEELTQFCKTHTIDKREEKIIGMGVVSVWNNITRSYCKVEKPVKVVNAFFYSEDILKTYFDVSNQERGVSV